MKDMVLALEWESSGVFRFVEAILDNCVVKVLSLQDELWRAFVKSVSGLLAGKCCVVAVEVLKGGKKVGNFRDVTERSALSGQGHSLLDHRFL